MGPAFGTYAAATPFLPNKGMTTQPKAAANLCREYSWACSRTGARAQPHEEGLRQARRISRHINRTTRSISDSQQYRKEDFWTLPSRRGGDCEDFAMLKKQQLIALGIAPEHLLLSTVLDARGGAHAVLIIRTEAGDFVIDNLTDAVRPWNRTGYTFLRMQDPSTPSRWIRVNTRG